MNQIISDSDGVEHGKGEGGIDSGLWALTMVARRHSKATDAAALERLLTLNGQLSRSEDLLRGFKSLGLKARLVRSRSPDSLESLPRPAILRMLDGRYVVLGKKLANGGSLFFDLKIKEADEEASFEQLCEDWTGEAIVVLRKVDDDKGEKEFGFQWFTDAIWKYRRPIIHIIIASMFIQICAIITPLLFQVVIDKVLVHKSYSTLYVVVAGMIGVGLLETALQFLRTYALSHTASRVDVELGSRLFNHLFKLPLAYFESRPVGQTIARVRELENVRNFLMGQGLTTLIDLVFMVVYALFLFNYSWKLAVVVLLSFPVYVLIAVVIRPVLQDKIAERFNRGAISQQFLVEAVVGAHTVKAGAIEPLFNHQWDEKLAAYIRTAFQATAIGNIGQNLVQYVSKFTTSLVLLIGAKAVIDGDLTVGELIAFNMISSQMMTPILRLSQLWQDFQQTQMSVERIGDIFEATPEYEAPTSHHLPRIRGSIKFSEVGFRYGGDQPAVLERVSLEIPPGQCLGIVGPSGSGKSTFTKLLQRLYLPTQGRVQIDGMDIVHADPAWLRGQIGVVLQENFLFNRSIHDNIALARPAMTRAEVMKVARLAGADEFIRRLPQGYDTMIVERGANLSGGQRQRVAIARALATNPRILILDEATSALDYESERIIQDNMADIVKGRTVIIVAHRLAAVRNCDRIIGLSEGKIVEEGSHASLMEREGGLYRHLWNLQSA